MTCRIALLGIYHKSNTFVQQPTTIEDFKRYRWLTGNNIRTAYLDSSHEIGGMLEILDTAEVVLLPVMFAAAMAGGVIDCDTYDALVSEMFDKLTEVLPVDGCLVVCHGAAVTALHPDMDGHWLTLLREKTGSKIPVIGTLSPDANVSDAMVKATDVLIAYETPHTDRRETGKEAARLLIQCLNGSIKPVQYLLPLPLAISIELHNTSHEPVKSLCKYAAFINKTPGMLSTSVFTGFQYADVPEMGASFLIVSDGQHVDAGDAMDGMLMLVDLMERRFLTPMLSIKSQLSLLATYLKPVLMMDMGDNVEAGSTGAGTLLLKTLENFGDYTTFVCICDPEAVSEAVTYQKGDTFYLSFGRSQETAGGPFLTNVWLLDIIDGNLSVNNHPAEEEAFADMGKTVIVLTQQGNMVMLTSFKTLPASINQLTASGVPLEDFDIIVAKGVNTPVAAYETVCKTIIQVDTPGATRANITKLSYKNRRKPMFPFE